MQGVSAENGVARPIGAPTCPPWVALSTGGLVSSTSPPPVTRQPPGWHSTGGGSFGTQVPDVVLHSSQMSQVVVWWFCSQVPLPSQPAVVQAFPSVSVQGTLSSFGGLLHAP